MVCCFLECLTSTDSRHEPASLQIETPVFLIDTNVPGFWIALSKEGGRLVNIWHYGTFPQPHRRSV
eukprot:scaffold10055_cov63-Cyclotella_meneghiniana.AAC.13